MKCNIRHSILQADRAVPRYTSYPPAPHFRDLHSSHSYESWLKALPEDEKLSLYLHVPFCPKLCWYCGCNTKITQRYAPVEDYMHLMLREIDLLRAQLPYTGKVTHIHFGGGSPGMLRARDFAKIIEKLHTAFHVENHAEIAIELDPREITEGRIATYAQSGVNRVSLGVQDFDETVLTAVNRQQPFHLTYDALNLLRTYGIQKVNMDLLYGLPHQTLATMEETIDTALLLKPDRISLFGYAHVPWVKKHMRLINEDALPDKTLRFDLFEHGAQKLQENGYTAIGIDHFALPDDPLSIAAANGTLKRNFQGYTTDANQTMIGIGASSIGKFTQGYIQNHPDMPAYNSAILSGQLPAKKYYEFTNDDRLRSAIIESLMCQLRVNLHDICAQHHVDPSIFDGIWGPLLTYAQENLIRCDRDTGIICINPQARPITRLVCALFDAHLDTSNNAPAQRHAKAI